MNLAPDAIAAGYLVLRSPPDLIICDVNMPHMDGFEFVEALKGDATLPRIPVIFLTSYEEGDERGRGWARWAISPSRCAPTGFCAMVAQHVPGGTLPIG